MTMSAMTICKSPTADDTDLLIYLVGQEATPGMEQLRW